MLTLVRLTASPTVSASSQTAAFAPPSQGPVPVPFPAERLRAVAFAVTSAFEGGSPGSLQTVDDGVISYGLHQATLRSGALGRVLGSYLGIASSPAADGLREYVGLVAARDERLRMDARFLGLLRLAASEPEMMRAQEEVFSRDYWEPAYRKAQAAGIETPLGYAIFYDTAVQGGLAAILHRTEAELGEDGHTEPDFLASFLRNRRAYLLEVADMKRANGKSAQANMLENAADRRVGFFEELLRMGNFLQE